MKQATGMWASAGAIVGSLASLGCCLPFGFAAALGSGIAAAFLAALRPWLLGLSVGLLGLGFWQQRRARQCTLRGAIAGRILLWAAVVLVLSMILFPQQIAGIFANRI